MGTNDIDEIYHRMAVIRRERHKNVSESVAGAEAVIGWGRYTWMYPWIALCAAAAVGYLVYSGSHPRVPVRTATLADNTEASEPVAVASDKVQERSTTGPNLLFATWDFLYPVAVRVGQNYMLNLIERLFPTMTSGQSAPTQRAERPVGSVRD
jgi:hypothetical protein